jgi:hypothetical protein
MQIEIQTIFSNILLVHEELGLLDGTHFSLDGVKLSANVSKEWSGMLDELKQKRIKLQDKLQRVLAEHAQTDKQPELELERQKNANDASRHPGCNILLGACGKTDHAWHENKNRIDFMEWKALRESLSYALDLIDYRAFLGVSTELINDEQLLEFMHETRSDSMFIPDEAKRKSRIWLAQHKPLD